MRTHFALFGLSSLLALGAGCDPVLFSAELDAPEVCVGGLPLPFPAESIDATTDQAISGDELGVPDSDDLELKVKVRSLALTPVTGVTDLSFMQGLSVWAASADPASDLPDVTIIDMDAGDLQDDGSLYVEPPSPVEIGDHLRAGDVLFTVEVAGDRPEMTWAAEMELCVHANARFEKPR
jgi:hypothetical protein